MLFQRYFRSRLCHPEQGGTFTGDFSTDVNKSVTIVGGYNCDYSTVTGTTSIEGNMTIDYGSVTMENIEIREKYIS
jgi:hypothetical protein